MNKTHWNTVYLDGAVPPKVLADMAGACYRTMLSSLGKRARRKTRGE